MILLIISTAIAAAPIAQAKPVMDGPPPVKATTNGASIASDEAARMAAAFHLLDLLHYDETLNRQIAILIPIVSGSVIGNMAASPDGKMLADALVERGKGGHDRLAAIIGEEFASAFKKRYAELKEAAAHEYATQFTLAELQDLTAFYATPVGVKLLSKISEIQQNVGKAGAQIGQQAGVEAGKKAIERAIDEMLPELKDKQVTS